MPLPAHLLADDLDVRVSSLLEDAKVLSEASFCSHRILDRVPWIFADDRALYIEWKQKLADRLGVDPYALCIVGSAATGISLSPSKNLRLFRDSSDVDVAIISSRHFDLAWHALRSASRDGLISSKTKKQALRRHRSGGLLFDGCIATDSSLSLLPFRSVWADALGRAGQGPPIAGHQVRTRLYRDFESLREYQLRSVTIAMQRIKEAV